MCSVYVNADPIQYEARTRSIRINNVLTTIRLENLFWDVLAEIASREDKTTNQMIAALYSELFVRREDSTNFTSFLRVCCLRYLRTVRHLSRQHSEPWFSLPTRCSTIDPLEILIWLSPQSCTPEQARSHPPTQTAFPSITACFA